MDMKKFLLIGLCCLSLISCNFGDRDETPHNRSAFYRSQWSAISHKGYLCSENDITILDFDLYNEGCFTFFSNDSWFLSGDVITTQRYHVTRANDTSWIIYDFWFNDESCDLVIYSQDGQYADLRFLDSNGYEFDRYTIRRNNTIIDINQYLVD